MPYHVSLLERHTLILLRSIELNVPETVPSVLGNHVSDEQNSIQKIQNVTKLIKWEVSFYPLE